MEKNKIDIENSNNNKNNIIKPITIDSVEKENKSGLNKYCYC